MCVWLILNDLVYLPKSVTNIGCMHIGSGEGGDA